MSEETVKEVKIEIQLDEETSKGQYINAVISQYSPTEFILDFLFIAPGQSKTKVGSRVILAPEHAKRLMQNLKNNIDSYEQNFGKITLHNQLITPKMAATEVN